MNIPQSLEQKRAATAWDDFKAVPDHSKKEYITVAKDAPTAIQINGLGQTLSFWLANAKKKAYFQQIYDDTSKWVMNQLGHADQTLLDWIINKASSQEYRHATREAMAYLAWLKRFAQAEEEVK